MQIIFNVDQRASIRRGVNCASTVQLDVDVSTLTPAQRDFIAVNFEDGRLVGAVLNEPSLKGFNEWLEFALCRHEARMAEENRLISEAMRSMAVREVLPDDDTIFALRETDGSVTYNWLEVIDDESARGQAAFENVTHSHAVSAAFKLIRKTPEYESYYSWLCSEQVRLFDIAQPLALADLERNEASLLMDVNKCV